MRAQRARPGQLELAIELKSARCCDGFPTKVGAGNPAVFAEVLEEPLKKN